MPKYSIILPVRNGGSLIKVCVHSILSQSLKDFTFHILDNCSTDGTLEWLKSLEDERIEIHPSEVDLSIEENWKRILTLRKNEFITLIGHDDLLEPDYLQVMDELIRLNPEANLYQTHFRFIDEYGRIIRKCKPMPEKMVASVFLSLFLRNELDAMGTGFMMRGSDYDSVKGIPVSYPNLLFADFELWISLIRDGFIAISRKECFAFRLHASTTNQSPDIKFQAAFEHFINYLGKIKDSDSAIKTAVHQHAHQFVQFYAKGLSHRLLRTPVKKRQGLTVAVFLDRCRQFAEKLKPGEGFNPEKQFSVKLARIIDSNFLTRSLFLLFKRIWRKPIYS